MMASHRAVCRQWSRSSLVQAPHSLKQPAKSYSSLASLTSLSCRLQKRCLAQRSAPFRHLPKICSNLESTAIATATETAGNGVLSVEKDPINSKDEKDRIKSKDEKDPIKSKDEKDRIKSKDEKDPLKSKDEKDCIEGKDGKDLMKSKDEKDPVKRRESLWAGGGKFPFFHREGAEPVAVYYEPEKSTLDTKALRSYCGTERDHIEILLDDGEWCAMSETVRTQEFWEAVKGDGTKESPFCVRQPAPDPYADRIKAFSNPAINWSSYDTLHSLQHIDASGCGVPGEDQQRFFWNHRPATPAALQAILAYPGFGRFLDSIRQGKDVLTEEDYLDAGRVAAAGHRIYRLEEDRRLAVNGALGDVLGREISPLVMKAQVPSGSTRIMTNGSLHHDENGVSYMYVNTEVRNEGGGVYFEGQSYYRAKCADESCKPLIQASNAPCFGIDMPGPLLRVNAMWYQSHIQAEPLTVAHNLLSLEQYNLPQMEDLALTLRALKQEVSRLEEFVQETVRSGDPGVREEFLERDLPYPFYMDWDDGENILRSLTSLEKPGGVSPRQRLWLGKLPSGESVVVKFAMTYGKAVHEAWAHGGYAPKVYTCRRLPGGWYVIVMEFLSRDDGWYNMFDLEDSLRQELLPYVTAHLRFAHKLEVDSNGRRGVLGDCQHQNVMVRFNQVRPRGPEARDAVGVRFIDFDWAGVEGIHRYPPFMSTRIRWPMGASPGWVLLQKHDIDLLQV